jgi:hypothetical protein
MDCLTALSPRRCAHVLRLAIVLLIGSVAGLSFAPASRAEDGPSPVPTLAEISTTLKARNGRIESMAVSHTIQAEALEDRHVLSKQMRLGYLENVSIDFAFKKEKRYIKVVESEFVDPLIPGPDPVKGRIRTHGSIQSAFDGKVLRRKKLSQDMVDVRSPSLAGDDQHWFPQEYMMNIGMALPNVFEAASDEQRKLFQLADLLASGKDIVGPRAEAVEGIPCWVVGIAHRQLFWLDPALGYAVRKIETFNAKNRLLAGRRRNFDFVEVSPGIWLPKTCWFDWCGFEGVAAPYLGKPMVRYVSKVTKLSINDVPDSLFSLSIEPGQLVVDNSYGNGAAVPAATYVMPADPSKLDDTIRLALGENRRLRSNWSVVLWLNLSFAMVLGGWFLYRRRKKARIA